MTWWIWGLNGVGLIISFIGSVLIFFRGPKAIIGVGNMFWETEEKLRASDDPTVKTAIGKLDSDRSKLKFGFWLVAAGFLVQVIAWALSAPSGIH